MAASDSQTALPLHSGPMLLLFRVHQMTIEDWKLGDSSHAKPPTARPGATAHIPDKFFVVVAQDFGLRHDNNLEFALLGLLPEAKQS